VTNDTDFSADSLSSGERTDASGALFKSGSKAESQDSHGGDDETQGRPDVLPSRMTMDQAEQLSELIARFMMQRSIPRCGATCSASRRFVGGPVAAIFAKSPTALTGTVYYHSSGKDPVYRKLYFNKYIKFDPFTTAQYFSDVEQPMAVAISCLTRSSWKRGFTRSGSSHRHVDAVTAVLG